MGSNLVLKVPASKVAALRAQLERGDFKFQSRPHAHFLARRPGVTLTLYRSGKLLVTGAQAAEYAGVLTGLGLAEGEAPETPPARDAELPVPRIGQDEAGKGDFFGPLTVAAVHVPDRATERALRDAGVQDSKRVRDDDARRLARMVRDRCATALRVLEPAEYNRVYARDRNLNILLGRLHAEVLEDLLGRAEAGVTTIDRFARDPRRVTSSLGPRGRRVDVRQVEGAEGLDLAVAAASLVARAAFLDGLDALGKRWGLRLPKGASAPVLRAGRRFVQEHGADRVSEVAKTHFRTARRIGA